jgi:hypothetical protein
MTTPGPTLVFTCPSCQHPFKEYTFASGNTFAAQFRSDSWIYATALPLTPPLVVCPHCKAGIAIYSMSPIAEYLSNYHGSFTDRLNGIEQSCEEIELIKRFEILDEKYGNTPYLKEAHLATYFEFLENNTLDSKYELDIRRHAWWLANDLMFPNTNPNFSDNHRSGADTAATEFANNNRFKTHHTLNLEILLTSMTATDEGSRLIKAELLRELGRFHDARHVLNGDFTNKAVVEQILHHIDRKNSEPFLLAEGDKSVGNVVWWVS